MVVPEDAGSGLAPASAAKAASLRILLGYPHATSTIAAATDPTPTSSVKTPITKGPFGAFFSWAQLKTRSPMVRAFTSMLYSPTKFRARFDQLSERTRLVPVKNPRIINESTAMPGPAGYLHWISCRETVLAKREGGICGVRGIIRGLWAEYTVIL